MAVASLAAAATAGVTDDHAYTCRVRAGLGATATGPSATGRRSAGRRGSLADDLLGIAAAAARDCKASESMTTAAERATATCPGAGAFVIRSATSSENSVIAAQTATMQ